MSRYIDADALKKDIARLHVLNDEAEIRRTYEYNPHVTTTDFEETLVSVFDAIDDAPSIDIVFCKDCKRGEVVRNHSIGFCENQRGVRSVITESSYCSYGERKESE